MCLDKAIVAHILQLKAPGWYHECSFYITEDRKPDAWFVVFFHVCPSFCLSVYQTLIFKSFKCIKQMNFFGQT